jgi:alanine-synthesizing transaminase
LISARVPSLQALNPWSKRLSQLRESASPLIDLTETIPSRVGLGPDVADLLAGVDFKRFEQDPRGMASAREAVATYYSERGSVVDPRNIVLTSSTSEAYAHLFRLLADPGDRILVPGPGYPLCDPIARLEGIQLDRWRLAFDGAWHLDESSLPSAPARGVVLVQPNHPTGTCLSGDELVRIENFCESHDAALISDEVFSDFMWDATDSSTSAALAIPRRVPTFVLSGLSKVCGLPQVKLSWIVLAGPEARLGPLREGLAWIADLFLSVATPVQISLPRLLRGRHEFQDRCLRRIRENRARLAVAAHAQPAMAVMPAAGGWVAMLRVPEVRSDEAWSLELLERGVVVHPGHFYDADEQTCVIVSLIVSPDVFSAGVAVIEELVAAG